MLNLIDETSLVHHICFDRPSLPNRSVLHGEPFRDTYPPAFGTGFDLDLSGSQIETSLYSVAGWNWNLEVLYRLLL